MDPLSVAGLALGCASLAAQVFSGCMQAIQLLITAKGYRKDCQYLNLRLRMEQQRLFAWSETSGLLDQDPEKLTSNNTFMLHRSTVIDLLIQIDFLFKQFREKQAQFIELETPAPNDDAFHNPEKDAREANFPISERKAKFLRKIMSEKSKEGVKRFKWTVFQKDAFEGLLVRFSQLNNDMTSILDARLQKEIHHTVQDTNRGVLQLHHQIADLQRLVMAVSIRVEQNSQQAFSPVAVPQKAGGQNALMDLLRQLAQFKAFNESMEPSRQQVQWDAETARSLNLDTKNLKLRKGNIRLITQTPSRGVDVTLEQLDGARCEAYYTEHANEKPRRVWIEWRNYDQKPGDLVPSKPIIEERVKKLAALLNHPKPEQFCTPTCLGWFDKATSLPLPQAPDSDDEDIQNLRLGLVFERPREAADNDKPPVSLRQLLEDEDAPRPSITARVRLARAIASCLLYIHSVNWLHKGLRSHNIVFFPAAVRGSKSPDPVIDYSRPILSGFDFSRPARNEEMTEMPDDDAESNIYRHPLAQTTAAYLAAPVSPTKAGSLSATFPAQGRERYRRSFDIYALGVLLVEIAHWKPVHRILGMQARDHPSAVGQVRNRLLDPRQQELLAACMGEVYQRAALRCIEGGPGLGVRNGENENEDEIAARIGRALDENVVSKLEEIVV